MPVVQLQLVKLPQLHYNGQVSQKVSKREKLLDLEHITDRKVKHVSESCSPAAIAIKGAVILIVPR